MHAVGGAPSPPAERLVVMIQCRSYYSSLWRLEKDYRHFATLVEFLVQTMAHIHWPVRRVAVHWMVLRVGAAGRARAATPPATLALVLPASTPSPLPRLQAMCAKVLSRRELDKLAWAALQQKTVVDHGYVPDPLQQVCVCVCARVCACVCVCVGVGGWVWVWVWVGVPAPGLAAPLLPPFAVNDALAAPPPPCRTDRRDHCRQHAGHDCQAGGGGLRPPGARELDYGERGGSGGGCVGRSPACLPPRSAGPGLRDALQPWRLQWLAGHSLGSRLRGR